MELRLLTPDDNPAQKTLMSEAFSGGRRPAPSSEDRADTAQKLEETTKQPPILGIFEGSRLVASLTIEDLHLFWGDDIVPLGGIAGVACTADQRGRGHVGRLLIESLRTMRDAGQYLSGLFPFSVAFYRRYGWEWVGEKRTFTIPTSEIKAYPQGKHLRNYEGPEALEIIRSVYETFARQSCGMMTRTDPIPSFWDHALKHHDNRTTYVQVYINPETDQAEAYLTFRYPQDGDTGRVGEFFANTPAGYRGLLSVLHYYGTQVRRVRFSGPADSPLPLYVMHNDMEAKTEPLFMGRVVDVTAAFTALHPPADLSGRVALKVIDEHAEWNQQTFALNIDAGRITVTTVTEEPGITLDIQTLSQAYWGQPSLAQLRKSDRLSVTEETQYCLLAQVLPSRVCYLQDGF
jgi:predicted acetyltransferase